MKVKELINELSKYNDTAEVVLPGYENYYDSVDTVEKIVLLMDAFKSSSWGGCHFEADSDDGRDRLQKVPTHPRTLGVFLHYSKGQNG